MAGRKSAIFTHAGAFTTPRLRTIHIFCVTASVCDTYALTQWTLKSFPVSFLLNFLASTFHFLSCESQGIHSSNTSIADEFILELNFNNMRTSQNIKSQ